MICNNNNTILYIDPTNGSYIFQNADGRMIQIAPDDLYMTDKYGNTTSLTNLGLTYKQQYPSYDELYEYWIKTKDMIKEN